MSQLNEIRKHLDSGRSLTPREAWFLYSCFRLAARIHDLRSSGYPVDVTIVERGGKRFAQYRKGRK